MVGHRTTPLKSHRKNCCYLQTNGGRTNRRAALKTFDLALKLHDSKRRGGKDSGVQAEEEMEAHETMANAGRRRRSPRVKLIDFADLCWIERSSLECVGRCVSIFFWTKLPGGSWDSWERTKERICKITTVEILKFICGNKAQVHNETTDSRSRETHVRLR
ncbi:uncharacterized protein LOC9646213 [Selaginella moellendorffii]|uniref:uncharacterized protein LOC9646213 n=1 Tax=Selaginella moellendorffii TaxID=88036 RepID=UPI000D1C7A77|nr:uncharacterized protein LOC9646213 [Selaginella moellendorffii]XP_024536525.1 uncharacterized protein LOC9646213 [Selaginella moellendorffii]|eukprot:XP_024536524.1 uncharacterized protein LOC9646213 [Selaginella moellendorffii]